MGMFFEILNSINDPRRQGSVEQLSQIMSGIQALQKQQHLDGKTTQKMISAVGPVMQSALKQQPGGENALSQLAVSELAAGGSGSAIQQLLTPKLREQMMQGVAQKTGLSAKVLQAVMPKLLPLVCQIFHLGATKPGMNGRSGTNQILKAFLNHDGASEEDLGDVFRFAGRFLNLA